MVLLPVVFSQNKLAKSLHIANLESLNCSTEALKFFKLSRVMLTYLKVIEYYNFEKQNLF